MTIGVTGATGFLGSYLLQFLQASGQYQIRALTRTASLPTTHEKKGVQWIKGDLSYRQDCIDFIQNLDVVVHLAHTNIPLTSNRDLPGDAITNLIPTLNLLEAMRSNSRKLHILYASSGGAVYGSSPHHRAFKESDQCVPKSSYGIQKLAAEHYLRLWAAEGHCTATVLRISNPYGVLLSPERLQGFIGIALSEILANQPVRLIGNPDNVRDFIHLQDMCRAIVRCLEPRKSFDIFNVGTGIGHSVREVLALLESNTGRSVPRLIVDYDSSANLVDWSVLDTGKARTELQWEPEIQLEDGLKILCQEALRGG